MNSDVIQVLSRPAAEAAQPCITSPNARSMVTSKTPRRITLSRLFETRNLSNSKIARGSGDHQLMGPTVHGKIPLRYAASNRATDKSPPTATNPRESARRGSGKDISGPSEIGMAVFAFVNI